MSARGAGAGPRPGGPVETELRRLDERWSTVPAEQTQRYADPLGRVTQELADDGERRAGRPRRAVPGAGPVALVWRLSVVAREVVAGGAAEDAVAARLAALRRELAPQPLPPGRRADR